MRNLRRHTKIYTITDGSFGSNSSRRPSSCFSTRRVCKINVIFFKMLFFIVYLRKRILIITFQCLRK